jgi:hypothetical protein
LPPTWLSAVRRTSIKLFDVWVDHPSVDYIFAIVLAFAADVIDPVINSDSRTVAKQTFAEISVGLLTLGSIALSVLVAVAPTRQLAEALAEAGRNLIKIIFHCLGHLLFTTLVFGGLLLSTDEHLHDVRVGSFAIAASLMALASARLLYLLFRLIALSLSRLTTFASNAPTQTR